MAWPRPSLQHDAARLITGETLYVDGGYHTVPINVRKLSKGRWLAYRYWHKADIRSCTAHVRFGGKADMPFALHMSAYDPKRTLGLNSPLTAHRKVLGFKRCTKCVFLGGT